MDTSLRRRIRIALVIGGALAALCTLARLPIALAFPFGRSWQAYAFVTGQLAGIGFDAVTVATFEMMILGGLYALLLVSGSPLSRGLATVVVAWFIYAHWAFSVSPYWSNVIANTGDPTPLLAFMSVGAAAMLTITVVAFVTASRLRIPASAQEAATPLPA